MVRLLIRPAAADDLELAAAHIAIGSITVAEEFVTAVFETFDNLRQFPFAGPELQSDEPFLQGLRKVNVIGFRNYLVFYRCTAESVEVLRVLHGSRDLPPALREVDDF